MGLPQYDMVKFIENVQRRCTVPTSQLTYTNEEWALIANDEMQDEVIPLIMSTREEYFLDYVDISLPSTGIIPFPNDSIGVKLRSVCYVQNSNPIVLTNLPRFDLDIVSGRSSVSFSTIAGFYIQGNDLYLYPNTALPQGSTIRLYFFKRRLQLTSPANYGQVVAVDSGTNTIQLSQVPASWATSTKLNSISSEPNFNTTNEEMTVVSVSSPSVIVDDVTGVSINDYVSEMGFSAIPQIPLEAHGYLAQLTAVKALEGVGDRAGMEAAQVKADKMVKGLFIMTSQRVDGSGKKIISPNKLFSSNSYGFNRRRGRF